MIAALSLYISRPHTHPVLSTPILHNLLNINLLIDYLTKILYYLVFRYTTLFYLNLSMYIWV